MSQKYFLITYGCQMNRSDSERIASVLEKIGYKPASKSNEADLIVVNMCSVRQSAVDRIYGLLPKFEKIKSKNKKFKTILTGCVVKKDRDNLGKDFDLILNVKEMIKLPSLLRKQKTVKREGKNYLKITPKYNSFFSALIPISTGCRNACAYCVVPFTRGPLACRSRKDIVKEAEKAVSNGFKEIWLLGQNVNDYRSPEDASVNFAKLLKMVNDIQGNFWIRFTSPHPKNFSQELINTMARCQKVTPYLNLPIQSGSDTILKKMNRPYSANDYKIIIKKIRTAFKKHRKEIEQNISLSTDIIVGFPGETKKQFEETLKLLNDIKFDMAYIAKYSVRTGTAAAKTKDSVARYEKNRRWKILTDTLRDITLENNKKYIGKKLNVLIEKEKSGCLYGKTRSYKTIKILGPKKLVGQFAEATVVDAFPWGLKGILI